MEYIILDLDTATEEQLLATISCNNRTSRLMSSEIDKLKKVAAVAKKSSRSKSLIIEEETDKKTVPSVQTSYIDEDFENEVDYYYSALKELTKDNFEEKISEVLPSRKNYQYQRILLRIKAEIMRNLKEIKDFLNEEGLTVEEAVEFKDEIMLEHQKLKLIDEKLAYQEDLSEENKQQAENNLIFVPTIGGNIRVLDEIEHIDQEYYDRFLGLFQSIKDGTFKNVQRFSRNSDLAGLCEVKDFKTRVIFVRLDSNSYAIISAFTKKSDNDKGYRNMLVSRYSDYQGLEDALISNLDNPEFMELHKQYEEELFRKLTPTQKEMPAVKVKVGE